MQPRRLSSSPGRHRVSTLQMSSAQDGHGHLVITVFALVSESSSLLLFSQLVTVVPMNFVMPTGYRGLSCRSSV